MLEWAGYMLFQGVTTMLRGKFRGQRLWRMDVQPTAALLVHLPGYRHPAAGNLGVSDIGQLPWDKL